MLTAVILVHNEENRLRACLQSLSFCDSIIVIDDMSTDNSSKIALEYNALVVARSLQGDFAAQRNFADQKVKEGWIIHIDADEIVSEKLAEEIKIRISQQEEYAYRIKRVDVLYGKFLTHGEVATAAHRGFVRFYKKGSGIWKGSVHEYFETQRSEKTLSHPLAHYAHDGICSFLKSINNYSTLRAHELQQAHIQPSIFQALVFPPCKFIYTFFIKGGFIDGTEGFIYSFMMAFHSFLVRAKFYQFTYLSSSQQ